MVGSHGFGGAINRVVVSGAETNGVYCVVELTVPAGSGPPSHIHLNEDEHFLILEGDIEFCVGGDFHARTVGQSALVPKGERHSFMNKSDQPAKMLAVFRPAGIEGFFEYGDPAVVGANPDIELLRARFDEYASRFGVVPVGD